MRNPKFLGVFSRSAHGVQGRGRKQLYFVWEVDKNDYIVQELNEALVPKARPERIDGARFQTGYRLEPGILAAPVTAPDPRSVGKKAPRAGEPTELTDQALAELEKARKIRQVENDLRANFNKALRALNRPRERKGALAALESIAETRAGIVPGHKHMFRDFGVSLRKKSLPELSLRCARRVLELSPEDDHAHFNMARVLTILGYYDQARAHMDKAIQLDSSERVYQRMLNYINSVSVQR